MRSCVADDPVRRIRHRHGDRVVGQIESDNGRRGGPDVHPVRSDVLQPARAGRSRDGSRRPAGRTRSRRREAQQEERLGPDVAAPQLPTGYANEII